MDAGEDSGKYIIKCGAVIYTCLQIKDMKVLDMYLAEDTVPFIKGNSS